MRNSIHVRRAATLVAAALLLLPNLSTAKKKPTSQPTTAPVDAGKPGTFRPMTFADTVKTIAVTEDGKYLLLGQEAADKITVWDIAAEKVSRTLAAPSPRAMLCRNGKLYVGSYGHGKVLVFDVATWSQTDELLTGVTDVVDLSAAAGNAFHDRLIASCNATDTRGGSGDTAVVIDTAHDTRVSFEGAGHSIVTLDGKRVIQIGGGGGRAWPIDQWLDGGPQGKSPQRLQIPNTFAYQAGPAHWVYTQQDMFTGDGRTMVKSKAGEIVVPDVTRPVVYALSDTAITAYQTDDTLDSLGKTSVKYAGLTRQRTHKYDVRDLLKQDVRRREGYFDQPVATAIDGKLHVFIIDAKGALQSATFDDFVSPITPMPAGVVASDDDPGAALPVDKPFTRTVPVPAGSTATLVSGPRGMTLGDDHVLHWTPTAAMAGTTQNVKIRIDPADHTGGSTFVRYALGVAGAAVATATPGEAKPLAPAVHAHREPVAHKNPADEGPPTLAQLTEQHVITLPYDRMTAVRDYAFASSIDGHCAWVISGRTLIETDLTGAVAVHTRPLPRKYGHLFERDAYFVALSANTLDLLNKSTLAVEKSIKLHTSEVFDLAIHPTLRMAYVAIHDPDLSADKSLRSRRVVEVNETTGQVTMVPGIYGQWLAADPLGRRLFVGVHDAYQNGYHLDFNLDDFIQPSYGDIDFLAVMPLTNGLVQRGHAINDPGVNGEGISVSPDGSMVSYISGAGRPMYSYAVPALNPLNLNDTLATYSLKDVGFPKDLAYHPTLPLVAGMTDGRVVLFDRATGDRLDDKLGPQPMREIHDMDHVSFSPDGKSVVIDPPFEILNDKHDGEKFIQIRRLFSMPINLTDEELRSLKKAHPNVARTAPAPSAAPAAPEPNPTPNDDAPPTSRIRA